MTEQPGAALFEHIITHVAGCWIDRREPVEFGYRYVVKPSQDSPLSFSAVLGGQDQTEAYMLASRILRDIAAWPDVANEESGGA